MKYTTLATSLTMASLALAQRLSDLPLCATRCLDDAIKQVSTCSTTDLGCICQKFGAIQGAAAGCVIGACGRDVALTQVLPITQQLCAKTAPGSSGANTRNSQPGHSGSVAPQPTTPSGTPGTTPAASVSATSTDLSTSAVSTATSSPMSTAGAAMVGPAGGLAMLVAGGLALL
ncbi:hypothetical protein E4U21_007657 [Claviceps maximensis]|nr:hypothetical protein E4U21_007657 [Claviceps maximensis]